MGRKIKSKAIESRGWHRNPGIVGRPGRGLTAYEPKDPRCDPDECQHGQIKDIGGAPGPISRCLDCGCLVFTAGRALYDDPQPLLDSRLDQARQEWNQIQFGAPE